MTRTVALHYPPDLYEAPELAILTALDVILQQTAYALYAAHPEMTHADPTEHEWSREPDLWVADALCEQISALQHAIERYKQATQAVHRLRQVSSYIE